MRITISLIFREFDLMKLYGLEQPHRRYKKLRSTASRITVYTHKLEIPTSNERYIINESETVRRCRGGDSNETVGAVRWGCNRGEQWYSGTGTMGTVEH